MMSETINTVVNNLSDRLGEVVEFVRPVIETINAVSIAVVHETALAGGAYVVVGAIAMILTIPLILCSIRACRLLGKAEDERDKEKQWGYLCTFVLTLIFGSISLITGIACVLANLGCFLAPTREVLREIMVHV